LSDDSDKLEALFDASALANAEVFEKLIQKIQLVNLLKC